MPLYGRALESKSKNPIIVDKKAIEITQELNKALKNSSKKIHKKLVMGKLPRKLNVTLSLRTRCFDRYVQKFLLKAPDGIIVNMGCGLGTRFPRVDNGKLEWYDLDFPEVIEIRRKFFEENERYHLIASSVLDFEWMEPLAKKNNRAFLFLAEGLFMYLQEKEVQSLVLKLQSAFKGSELVCEVVSKRIVRLMRKEWARKKFQRKMHFGKDAVFISGIEKSNDFEALDPGIRFLDEWTFFDDKEKKLGWMRLFARSELFRKTQWVVHYKLN